MSELRSPDLVLALLSVVRMLRAIRSIELEKIGLNVGQDEVLLALKLGEAMPVTELARHISVQPSTASKMIDRLVRGGFVERHLHAGDARRSMIRLSQRGMEMQSAVGAIWIRIEEELASVGADDKTLSRLRAFEHGVSKMLKAVRR
ncbi:MarR family winged helix-turn-helix transcriptional regulator [Aureimonas sp. AU4]|uniref:MarR family winged helix-turn-helix transcriptional regulator n=1 Tax=Aureimonas sp. AU4 TaxID=1638163 RepID=UPI0007820E8F|nr:MarR family transcriptional regulator [Aureimonas sp. AU4]